MSHLTGLQQLSLSRVTLRGEGQDALRWVQANMQLTQLQLCRVEGLTYALSVPTGHAALTSLPMLQDLELHQLLLTRTAFMLMFQEPGHVLQQLTKLQLIVPDEWQYWEPYQLSLPEVIAGCPSLRQLDVEHLLINVHDIQMLSGLSSLTSLCITPVQKSTITWLGLDVGVQALMCLTGLKALRLPSSTYLHSEELRSLTCLQQLTYLGLDW